jgi:hypothetical protein
MLIVFLHICTVCVTVWVKFAISSIFVFVIRLLACETLLENHRDHEAV